MPRMVAAPFRHRHRVTYAECTVGNHVYYARYLDLLEHARGELFRAAGWPLAALQTQDILFPVVEVQLHYEAPARYDDELVIEVVATEFDRLKVTFAYGVSNARNQIILTGHTRHVCTGLDEKPKRLPPEIFHKLNAVFTGAPLPTASPRAPKLPH